MSEFSNLQNLMIQLKSVIPGLSDEVACDLLLKNQLNLNAAVEEHFRQNAKPTSTPTTAASAPTNNTTKPNDLFDFMGFDGPTNSSGLHSNNTTGHTSAKSTPNTTALFDDDFFLTGSPNTSTISNATPGLSPIRSATSPSKDLIFADFDFTNVSSSTPSVPTSSSAPEVSSESDRSSKKHSKKKDESKEHHKSDKKAKKEKAEKAEKADKEPKEAKKSKSDTHIETKQSDTDKRKSLAQSDKDLKRLEKEKKRQEEEKKIKDEKEKKKMEKEKKREEERKAKEEKDRKKHEDEAKKHEEKDKRKSIRSLKKVDANQLAEAVKEAEANGTGEEEEELSKDDEPAIQWIAKLKKAPKSRLITIHNHTTIVFERAKMHEGKGKWRRKPPDFIQPRMAIQFGVEGKLTTEGSCSYVMDGVVSPMEFFWGNADTPIVSFVLPKGMERITISITEKNTDKFSDVTFSINDKESESKEVSMPPSDIQKHPEPASSIGSSNESFNSLSDVKHHTEGRSVDEYSNSSSSIKGDDSSSDEEEEDKKRTMLRTLHLKPVDQVEKVDTKTLQQAATKLTLVGASQATTRSRSRRSTLNGTNTLSSGSIPDIPREPTPEEQEPNKLNSMNAKSSVPLEEVEERSKELMKDVFAQLEAGNFRDSLKFVNEILHLLDPNVKQKEAKICTIYKLALKLLIAKGEAHNPDKEAILSSYLAQLQLQPKHRIVCIRMAIRSCMACQNFGTAAKFLEVVLPLNLSDKSSQEAMLVTCQQHKLEDKLTIPFPSLCCAATLEHLSGSFYQCTYCDAKYSTNAGRGMSKCIYCNFGTLVINNKS